MNGGMWLTVEPEPVEPDVPDPSVAVEPDTPGDAEPDVPDTECEWSPALPMDPVSHAFAKMDVEPKSTLFEPVRFSASVLWLWSPSVDVVALNEWSCDATDSPEPEWLCDGVEWVCAMTDA